VLSKLSHSIYSFTLSRDELTGTSYLLPASPKPVPFHLSIHTLKGRIDWNKQATYCQRHSSLSHPILSPESHTLTLVYYLLQVNSLGFHLHPCSSHDLSTGFQHS
jgi:hypothetical protein